ncbi:MAG: sigma-54-dependent Fis family transcriptional regulator [bacterium]|nr:sigma-54-dependent Fis family transcriptional regulator [bacterium]
MDRILRPEGHTLIAASGWAELEPQLADPSLDLILLDLVLGAVDGISVLERIKAERPDLEVIVMTGYASVESAVGCMRLGAFDYLEKPVGDIHRVRNSVRRAIERRRLLDRTRILEQELAGREGSPELIGGAPSMRAIVRMIESLRHNESNVLVQGESGTGKEIVARAVHAASPRRDCTFVPVDCGALPESIIESELFGHEKGAFTGATGAPGLFRVADGGTLFLDEIGEILPSVQAKLLRALQQKEVRPVGASSAVPVDIRVVCATNRDLSEMVAEGSFRQDLYYRLNVVRIELPPLRERGEDVALLAQHLLQKHLRSDSPVRGFTPEALERLCRYPWPGNVRELENAIESAMALSQSERLHAADFRLGGSTPLPVVSTPSVGAAVPLSLEAYERLALERALEESRGDASEAARRLGIGRSTLYRKLSKHAIEVRRRPTKPTAPADLTDSVGTLEAVG